MRFFGNLLTCVFCEIMRFPAQQNLRQCKMTSLFHPSSRLEGYLLYLQFFSDGDVRGVQFPLSHVVFLSCHGLKNSQMCHHNCPCLHHLGTCWLQLRLCPPLKKIINLHLGPVPSSSLQKVARFTTFVRSESCVPGALASWFWVWS